MLGERKAIDFVWKNFTVVLFIISRRAMKSSKAKSITATLGEARAALLAYEQQAGLQRRCPRLGVAAGPIPAGLEPCHPLLVIIKLLYQLSEAQCEAGRDQSSWTN